MFWSVVLVLGLHNKALASIIISLAFTAPLELHLEALKVSLVLDYLDVPLENNNVLVNTKDIANK